MIINVGDKIVGNHGRTGEIINIGRNETQLL